MKILIMGGGTFSDVTPHLSLCTRAFGTTAKQLKEYCDKHQADSRLVLTKMADSSSSLITNADVHEYVQEALKDPELKAIIFNVAMCDFSGAVLNHFEQFRLESDKEYQMSLYPNTEKLIAKIKRQRPDIFLVSFKTTAEATQTNQKYKAHQQITNCNSDIVLANDITTRNNILVTKAFCSVGKREDLLDVIALEVIKQCYPSKPFNLTHPKDCLPPTENLIHIQV